MFRLISSEYQKLKRTFTKRAAFLAPIVTMLLCALLGAGTFFQSGSFNWWYTMLLPGMLSLICAGIVQKDKKKLNYRGIMSLAIEPRRIWLGKVGACILLYGISCVVFFIGVTIGGHIFGSFFTLAQSGTASLLLFVTFLWQIPFCMLIADRLGSFAAIFINLVGNILGVIFAAKSIYWWIPFAIPTRLMCPVIHVLPNGLTVPANDPLLSFSVIVSGVLITLVLFIVLSVLTALPYRRLEAK
ncbi:lantibiotic immunity ABC transporter MutE/EpiE family permease subunit [Desulfosporosinus acididurans]|uniref:lantibiotic immunity ABC transporter MutE/EpiE family permease subunit n=1 Tax=Desulfosporosinus acididurans TaxID=476652 RepID=UPI00064B7ED9|nr:lantibiotic immunity ABC transporter MutE/EpiE family permease subunit [Desulfosporosinus acididurans]